MPCRLQLCHLGCSCAISATVTSSLDQPAVASIPDYTGMGSLHAHTCIISTVLHPQILALGLRAHLHHERCLASSGVFHKLIHSPSGLCIAACERCLASSGMFHKLKHSPSGLCIAACERCLASSSMLHKPIHSPSGLCIAA